MKNNDVMLPFNERLKIGIPREGDFGNYLQDNFMIFKHNEIPSIEELPPSQERDDLIRNNLIYGDFELYTPYGRFFIDVKNSYNLYERSINNFTIDGYYALVPERQCEIEDGWVVRSRSLKAYYRKMKEHKSKYIRTAYEPNRLCATHYIQFKPNNFYCKIKVSEFIRLADTSKARHEFESKIDEVFIANKKKMNGR